MKEKIPIGARIKRSAFLVQCLRLLTILLGLFFLLLFGGWIYIRGHKAEIIRYIKTESAKQLNGELSIGDISISLFHTFPRISISLDQVSLRDSLWPAHHHDLLNARKTFASLDFFQLITGHFRVNKIILDDARIYVYTDSSGYSNMSVFKKRKEFSQPATEQQHYPNLEIRNSRLVIEKKNKNKFFSFEIPRLICKIKTRPDQSQLDLDINLVATVQSMAFNRQKGSFIQGKNLRGKFNARYNPGSRILQFDRIGIEIDRQSFTASGKFFLAEVPALFTLSLETQDLDFKKAVSFLTQNIRDKLNQYDISRGFNRVSCSLDGTDTGYKTPLIRVSVSVKNESVHAPFADLERATFNGYFTNEAIGGMGHDDENSLLRFTGLDGNWQKLDFHSDSAIIRNLRQPSLSCNVKSGFRLKVLNSLLDEKTFHFSRGSGKLDVQYKGPLTGETVMHGDLHGIFLMDSAFFTYLPRDFDLENGRGKIRFAGKDLFIDDLRINTGSTDLLMNGSMKNLFSVIDKQADQLILDLNIGSNKINLNDFKTFLRKKVSTASGQKNRRLLPETLSKITQLLETSSMELNLRARELSYKKFTATAVHANMLLNDNAINIRSLQLSQAGGSIEAQGSLRNETASNPFSCKVVLSQVDISKVFAAFSNFGQQAITDKNIQGILDARINLKGEVTQKIQLIPDSTKGQIDFNLQRGRLIDFGPVRQISRTIFKNRDFSDIGFAGLHDRFIINGNNITINRMEIRSTVMAMFVEGSYNMKKGADLSIQIPLSNLKNQSGNALPENQGIHRKTGPSARLRAKNGDDGKLRISWDPFNKAARKMKKKK